MTSGVCVNIRLLSTNLNFFIKMPAIPQPPITKKINLVPHWQAVDSITPSTLQENTREWLLDNGSLTLRVKNHCQNHYHNNFSVQVLSQGMAIPLDDEMQRLNLEKHCKALIREVLLFCGETPLIYARTIIPAQTLTGEQKQLADLGNRPLGEFLFSQPDLERDVMEVAQLKQGYQLFDSALFSLSPQPDHIWARRSVFRLADKPLLVAEVFLPDICQGN
ncbi:MAG: chorismate lyase [gamma proteobacterium symbiont of Taylorina sp.]|nr:chorismate lyase [gamma proteobacterium symbiont of Taylorina sp.]